MTGTFELFYLAQPYWHQDEHIRSLRTQAAEAAIAYLGGHMLKVYSPIAHWARAKSFMPNEVHGDHDFWMAHDLPILVRCDAMLILPLPGWQESRGLAQELAWARTHSIPVLQLTGSIPHNTLPLHPNDAHPHVVCSRYSPQFPLLNEV